MQGVLQPLMVRPLDAGHHEIVYGERRWRAAQLAGLTEVPVLVRELSVPEAETISAVENLQREDLNRYDEVTYKLRLVAQLFEATSEGPFNCSSSSALSLTTSRNGSPSSSSCSHSWAANSGAPSSPMA